MFTLHLSNTELFHGGLFLGVADRAKMKVGILCNALKMEFFVQSFCGVPAFNCFWLEFIGTV
jgi:hypothetical protein